MLKYKTVTVAKATAGTSWTPTARYIGTTGDFFGINADQVKCMQIRNASFTPAANASIGLFNNGIYVGASQNTTLNSDILIDVIYTD